MSELLVAATLSSRVHASQEQKPANERYESTSAPSTTRQLQMSL